ncbi:alpha/beta fold hydrolase [Nonomuraea wenchangensis]
MGARLAAEVPDGREATVEGAAHYPNLERPGGYNEIVRSFLDDVIV